MSTNQSNSKPNTNSSPATPVVDNGAVMAQLAAMQQRIAEMAAENAELRKEQEAEKAKTAKLQAHNAELQKKLDEGGGKQEAYLLPEELAKALMVDRYSKTAKTTGNTGWSMLVKTAEGYVGHIEVWTKTGLTEWKNGQKVVKATGEVVRSPKRAGQSAV
jgi:regulator of replication initiation timing